MHAKLLRRVLVGVLFATAIGMTWGLSAKDDQALEAQAVEDQAELTKLLPELVQARQRCFDLTTEAQKNGTAIFEEVVQAKRDLLEAKLQMRNTDAERIKIRERLVENARQWEDISQQQAATGNGRIEKYWKAVGMRIQAEIDLRRERISAALKH